MAGRSDRPNLTTAELARQLGLSRATVSYVLNGQAARRKIPEATARRVLDKAAREQFTPNDLARGLRLKRSGLIGFLVGSFTFNWAERVLTAMLPVLAQKGCLPFTMIHRWSPELEEQALAAMLQRRVDGVVCVPVPGREAAYRRLIRRGIPLLFLGDRLESMGDVSWVAWDVEPAAYAATRHLLSTGRRRVAFIAADHKTVMTRARFRGYSRAMGEAGVAVRREWVAWETVASFPSPPDMVRRMLERIFRPRRQGPDALFVGHDALAVRALDQLAARGIRVPDDVAVVSLCDLFLSDHAGINLSTVREPSEELGRRAGEIMMDLIERPDRPPVQELIKSVELMTRRTTDVREAASSPTLLGDRKRVCK